MPAHAEGFGFANVEAMSFGLPVITSTVGAAREIVDDKRGGLLVEPGDAVVLYTDGLPEARRDGELYGERRLDTALAANASLGAQELADALVEDCRAFAGEQLCVGFSEPAARTGDDGNLAVE